MTDSSPSAEQQASKSVQAEQEAGKSTRPDPVRRWTRIVLGICIALFFWYVISDRIAPYTDQARVRGYIVQIAPRVSGTIEEVNVGVNQIVEANDLLFTIDPSDFELAVERAEADLEAAGQETGADTNAVAAAQARLTEALAALEYHKEQAARYERLAATGAVSQVAEDRTRTSLLKAQADVNGAEAELEQARNQLGKEGAENVRIRSALAALNQARLDLARTEVRAPSRGVVTNARIDVGQYATAGKPLVSFVSLRDVWIEAYLRENSLGNVKVGDPVDIALDSAPGSVFHGEVASLTYAVRWSDQAAPGDLPTVTAPGGWLRDAQRFPVLISFVGDVPPGLRREGGQADVVVYTEASNFLFNGLGWLRIRLMSLLSYVY
jgi:multidrug resistance efflux pump